MRKDYRKLITSELASIRKLNPPRQEAPDLPWDFATYVLEPPLQALFAESGQNSRERMSWFILLRAFAFVHYSKQKCGAKSKWDYSRRRKLIDAAFARRKRGMKDVGAILRDVKTERALGFHESVPVLRKQFRTGLDEIEEIYPSLSRMKFATPELLQGLNDRRKEFGAMRRIRSRPVRREYSLSK